MGEAKTSRAGSEPGSVPMEPGAESATIQNLLRDARPLAPSPDLIRNATADARGIELPIAMLACARIGAPHSVVFGGFSADALAGRIDDAQCTTLITADGGYRKGAAVALKANADDAMGRSPSVQHCVVVKRTGDAVEWHEGRDHWWHDLTKDQPTTAEPEPMDSEDLLYLLYTSGTT